MHLVHLCNIKNNKLSNYFGQEWDYITLKLPSGTSALTEKSSGFNIKDNLNNALRKLQKLDEEDYDISQDEEMTDIIW